MNGITYKQYTREKNPERKVRKSQAQVLDVYCLHGNILAKMEFIDVNGDIDASYTSLDRAYTPPVQKKRKPSRTSEDNAKIKLQKSLAASLKPQEDNVNAKSESFERTTLFGTVVADSLLTLRSGAV